MKPGLGSYDRNGEDNFTRRSARIRFLIIVSQLEPRLLPSLHERTYKLFWELILTCRKKKISFKYEADGKALQQRIRDPFAPCDELPYWNALQQVKDSSALCDALLQWSKGYNLNADWCRNQAIETLWTWRDMSRDKRGLSWYRSREDDYKALQSGQDTEILLRSYSEPPIKAPPGLPGWRPRIELRQIYLARMRARIDFAFEENPLLSNATDLCKSIFIKSIEVSVKKYCNKVEEYYNALPGWKKCSLKEKLLRNLIWAALYQVGRLEYDNIAYVCGLRKGQKDEIGLAVRRILKSIDLNRPPQARRRGRPNESHTNISKTQLNITKKTVQDILSRITNKAVMDKNVYEVTSIDFEKEMAYESEMDLLRRVRDYLRPRPPQLPMI